MSGPSLKSIVAVFVLPLLPQLHAQGPLQVAVPDVLAASEGGASALIWRNGEARVQAIYDVAHFTARGIVQPIDIDRLQWRAVGGITGTAGSFPAVDVHLDHCATDHLVPSTVFAVNRSPGHTLVHSGAVPFTTVSGTTPNDWFVDLPLRAPFRYDPSAGSDLLVELVIHAAPSAAPALTSCSFDVPLHRAVVVRALGAPTAPTGFVSAFAPVLAIGYSVPAGAASASSYGRGCYDRAASFYEVFPPGAFDLAGSPGTAQNIRLVPNGLGGYAVQVGGSRWFTPQAAALALGDDSVSPPQPLGFAFAFPGGSTSAIHIGSNGHVWLVAPGSTSPTPTVPAFLAEGPRLCPLWTDLDPSTATGGGSVHFDTDTSNGAAYVTWSDVPLWEPVPSTPRPRNNVQLALFDSGEVEFRYLDCQPVLWPVLTGFSRGDGAVDGGGHDLTAAMPFDTRADRAALLHYASARPLLGATIGLVTTNIPPAAVFNAIWISNRAIDPGLPLSAFGMPECFVHVHQLDVALLLGTGTVVLQVTVPLDPVWIGRTIVSQAASLVPGVNPLGVLSSNGSRLEFGTL